MASIYQDDILSDLPCFRLILHDLAILCSALEWLLSRQELQATMFTTYTAADCRLESIDESASPIHGFEHSPLKKLRKVTSCTHLESVELGLPNKEWLLLLSTSSFSLVAAATRHNDDLEIKVSFRPDLVDRVLKWVESRTQESLLILRQIKENLLSEGSHDDFSSLLILKVLELQHTYLGPNASDDKRMFRLAEQSLDLIYRIQLHPKFQILYISPIVETWMGCSRHDLYEDARTAFRHIHPEDAEVLQKMMLEENASQGISVVRFLPASGDPYWIEHRWFVDRSTDRSVIVLDGVGRDITRQKREEEAISQALRAAEENARSKSLFLANMSHEIRTPLNAIIGQVELLKDTPLDGEQREMIESVFSAGQILLAHLTDVLDFSRLDAQRVKLHPASFSLVGALSEALSLVKDTARKKGLRLLRCFAPEIPERVVGDKSKLIQIVVNLLSNAVKFTEKGTVELRAACRTISSGLETTIEVCDTGIGFPPELLGELLLPFSQADPSSTRKQEGAGLGLAIVSRLVELMSGHLSVERSPRGGSLFRVKVTFESSEESLPWLDALKRDLAPILAGDDIGGFSCTPSFLRLAGVETELLRSLGLLRKESNRLLQLPNDPHGEGPATIINAPMCPETFLKTILLVESVSPSKLEPQLPSDLGILVVEDNDVNRQVLSRQLEKLGLKNYDFAIDGQDALERFSPQGHQLILMDIQMPMLDGVQTLRTLRKMYPELSTPAVAVTAHALPGDRENYLEAGFQGYLSKPVRLLPLREVLLEVLTSKKDSQL